MTKNLARRVIEFGITFFLAISINFLLPRLVPGDPLQLIAGNAAPQLGRARIDALRAQYGLLFTLVTWRTAIWDNPIDTAPENLSL
jgi:peptide/nickel transport system permease protein